MNADSGPAGQRWIHCFLPRPESTTRLFCFHHAGGNTSLFRTWARHLQPQHELIAVQLPGRAERFSEKAYDRMEPLVADLLDAIGPLLDRPFSFAGYSMGAYVALAAAQSLRSAGLPGPRALFVGACSGPSLGTPFPGWDEPDEQLLARLVELGGVSSEILADRGLVELVLPTIRADLTAVATWPYLEDPKIGCPVFAFAGTGDAEASPARTRAWAAATDEAFTLVEIDGGHFFIQEQENERLVVSTIDRRLAELASRHTR